MTKEKDMQQDLSFIKQQANDWLVKLETDGMTDGDETRFVEWMEQDERHGQAFYEAEQTWQLMHQAELKPAQTTKPQPSWLVRSLMPIAATILVVISSMLWWQDIYFATMSDHYTQTGQRLERTLTDGSKLTLNTDSAIDVQFSQSTRLVKVLSGEVYVTVAPDKQRPFVVEVGDMQVTALGTEFIVRKDGNDKPTVTVTEHSVKVESTSSKQVNLVLNQGFKVSLDENTAVLSEVKAVDIERAQAWRTGKYVFKEQTLQQVVTELNRYYKGKIVIRDQQLQQQRVTGVLDLDNPRTSLNNLARSLAIKVNSITPYLLLLETSE